MVPREPHFEQDIWADVIRLAMLLIVVSEDNIAPCNFFEMLAHVSGLFIIVIFIVVPGFVITGIVVARFGHNKRIFGDDRRDSLRFELGLDVVRMHIKCSTRANNDRKL